MTETEILAEDERWMRQALELAVAAEAQGEVPVGALVVLDGQELGVGFNAPISRCDATAHAEISAIQAACASRGNYRLSGATLYVTLEPCTMCAGALIHARISRLVFGAREPKAGAVVSRNRLLDHQAMNWRVAVREGVLGEQCRLQISDFFASRRAARKTQKQIGQLSPKGGEQCS